MELEHEFTVPVPVEQAWPVLLDIERVAPCMPGATLDSVEGDDFTGRLKVKVGPVTVTYRGKAGFTYQDEQNHTVTIEGSGKEARGSGTASATVRAQLHGEDGSTRVTVHTDLQVTGRPAQFGRNVMAEVGAKLIGKFADCLAGQLAGGEQAEPAPATASQAGPASTGASEQPAAQTSSTSTSETSGAAAAAASGTTASGRTSPAGAAASEVPASASPNGSATSTQDGQGRGSAQQTPTAGSRPTEGEPLDLLDVAGPSMTKRLVPAAGGLVALLALIFGIRGIRKKRRNRRS